MAEIRRAGPRCFGAAPARDNPLMIHILVANGADVNAGDKQGDTALMIAASQSNAGNVNALIESGARVNADVSYQTANLP